MKMPSWSQPDVRLITAGASLLLSVYSFAFRALPNDDAYVYVRTAEIYLDQGLEAAFAHYGWAGYSILIAMLSRLGPDLFTSAYLLNALLFALLAYAFVSIVALLDERRLTLALGALTVLFYPELNEYRWLIIRDIGFWAFALTGIWLLLRYCRTPSTPLAAGFTAVFLLAAVFRAEAIVYLLLLPLAALMEPAAHRQQRRWNFMRLALAAYGSILALFLILLAAGINLWQQVADFFSVYLPFLQTTFNPSPERTAELGRLLFGEYAATFSQEYMNGVIAAGLLVILFMSIFYGLSGAFFWVLVFGFFKGYTRPRQLLQRPILLAILINGLLLLVFLYVTRYLSSRYAMLLCLLLVTQLPVVVSRILDYFDGSGWERLGGSLVVLFFVYCAFDSYISFGRSRDYLLESAAYVAEEAAPDNGVLTNNHSIAYFSGRVAAYDEVDRTPSAASLLATRPGDMVALEMVDAVDDLLRQEDVAAALELERVFSGSGNQQIRVYRRAQP